MDKTNIAIFDQDIEAVGGMQRHTCELARFFIQRGFDVTVVTETDKSPYFSYHEDCHFKYIDFSVESINNFLTNNEIDLLYLQTGCARRGSINVARSCVSRNVIPMIVCEHSDPSRYPDNDFAEICGAASGIHLLTENQLKYVPKPLRNRSHIIGHPIGVSEGLAIHEDDKRENTVLYLGRFFPIKRLDILVHAWVDVRKHHSDWTLRLVGGGGIIDSLKELVAALRLEDSIEIIDFQKDVYSQYVRAKIFVMPSSKESFGLCTAEAMASQTPVIGFRQGSGTNELVIHGVTGLLAEDCGNLSESLAESIMKMIKNRETRVRMGRNSRERINMLYAVNTVYDKIDSLVQEVIQLAASKTP